MMFCGHEVVMMLCGPEVLVFWCLHEVFMAHVVCRVYIWGVSIRFEHEKVNYINVY